MCLCEVKGFGLRVEGLGLGFRVLGLRASGGYAGTKAKGFGNPTGLWCTKSSKLYAGEWSFRLACGFGAHVHV